MDLSLCGTDRRWLVHALSRSAGGFVSSGVTELRSELDEVCLRVLTFPTQDTHIPL